MPLIHILGAGSQIAPFLSRRLGDAGHKGDCVSRRPPPGQPPFHPAFAWKSADLSHGPSWAAPTDAVVFSTLPLWLLPPLLPRLRAARHIIAFSSTSVFAKSHSGDPAEQALAARLAEAEARLVDACAQSGVPWTILRPTLIYGSGRDHNVSAIAQVIRRFGVFPIARPGAGLRQPVHADDLAQAAVAALDSPQARNQALNLPGGETLPYREMVARVFTALGKTPRIVPLPTRLLAAALPLAQRHLPTRYSPALFLRMNQDLVFDAAPAAQALGYAPRPFQLRWDAERRALL